MRRIRPLKGQVLVELDAADIRSAGGIEFTRRPLSPEQVEERHTNPDKPPGLTGRVVACGGWPRLENGILLMPEFGVGARIVIPARTGTELHWDTTRRLKLIRQADVLAVLTPKNVC